MKIRLEHGLAYVEAVVTFRGRSLCLRDTILDTGSASTIFSADRLLEIGVVPEPPDELSRHRRKVSRCRRISIDEGSTSPAGVPKSPDLAPKSADSVPTSADGGAKIPGAAPKSPASVPKFAGGGAKFLDTVATASDAASKSADGGVNLPSAVPKSPDGVPKIPDGGAKSLGAVATASDAVPKSADGGAKVPDAVPKSPAGVAEWRDFATIFPSAGGGRPEPARSGVSFRHRSLAVCRLERTPSRSAAAPGRRGEGETP